MSLTFLYIKSHGEWLQILTPGPPPPQPHRWRRKYSWCRILKPLKAQFYGINHNNCVLVSDHKILNCVGCLHKSVDRQSPRNFLDFYFITQWGVYPQNLLSFLEDANPSFTHTLAVTVCKRSGLCFLTLSIFISTSLSLHFVSKQAF